ERDVDLAVGLRGIAGMRHPDRTFGVRPLLADLGRANRLAARRRVAASPVGLPVDVGRSRIAPLHDKTRQGAMEALTIVEAVAYELDDVLDGLRRLVRIRLERKRS